MARYQDRSLALPYKERKKVASIYTFPYILFIKNVGRSTMLHGTVKKLRLACKVGER
jgi:hypothetical protein